LKQQISRSKVRRKAIGKPGHELDFQKFNPNANIWIGFKFGLNLKSKM